MHTFYHVESATSLSKLTWTLLESNSLYSNILQTHSVHLSILTGPRTFIFSGKLAKADFYVNTKSTKKAAAVHDVK